MYLKYIGDNTKSTVLGISLAAALSVASLGAHAGTPDEAVSSSDLAQTDSSLQQKQTVPPLNTNPLNIQDSVWEAMKILSEKIKNSTNPQIIYKVVNGDPRYNTRIVHFVVPDEYWEMTKRTPPSTSDPKGVVMNITTLDYYVQRMAIQKGQTGVFIGLIGNDKRVIEAVASIQNKITHDHEFLKDSAAFVHGTYKVKPTDTELPSLSETQKERGLILYVRGVRYGHFDKTLSGKDSLGAGIYVDDKTFFHDLSGIWNLGLTHMNNQDYSAYVQKQIKNKNIAEKIESLNEARRYLDKFCRDYPTQCK